MAATDDSAAPAAPPRRRRLARLVGAVVGRHAAADPARLKVAAEHTPIAPPAPAAPAPPVPVPPEPGPAPGTASGPTPGPASAPPRVRAGEPAADAIAAARSARRRREFGALMKETYPSVAEMLIELSEQDPLDHTDDWLAVARLLSDDLRHRSGGLNAEARERAIRAAAVAAIEAQARSSARLAGYHEDQLDDPWEVDPEWPGQRVWEHYLCRESLLVRENLHGEALGDWLGALGALWSASDDLWREVEDRRALLRTPATPIDDEAAAAPRSPAAPREGVAAEVTADETTDIAADVAADIVEIVDDRGNPVDAVVTVATVTTRYDNGIEDAEVVGGPAAPATAGPAGDDERAPAPDPLTDALNRLRAALEAVKEAALW